MIQRVTSKYIPPVDLEIQPMVDGGYELLIKMPGCEDHPSLTFATLESAQKGLEKAKRDLLTNSKEIYKRAHKMNPVKQMSRESIQNFIIQLEENRMTNFLEGIQTLAFCSMMLSYQVDEAEGIWDGNIPDVMRNRLKKMVDAVDDFLDALKSARVLGESNDGYNDMCSDAYRFLDIINLLANFCRPTQSEEFRLVAVENALSNSLSHNVAEEIRHDRAMRAVEEIRNELRSKHNEITEK